MSYPPPPFSPLRGTRIQPHRRPFSVRTLSHRPLFFLPFFPFLMQHTRLYILPRDRVPAFTVVRVAIVSPFLCTPLPPLALELPWEKVYAP